MDEPRGFESQSNSVDEDIQNVETESDQDISSDGLEVDSVDDVEISIADLVTQLSAERDEYLKALQLTKADFDNYRRRTARLEAETAEKKLLGLIEKLLPSLDDLTSLVNHMIGTEEEVLISKTVSPLLGILATEGLEIIDQVQVPFDPELHQAVAHESGEEPATVSEVFRSGYSWKGKTLRPAMVKVVG